jgi:RimJ/RimL family protein N-acetyltransferase
VLTDHWPLLGLRLATSRLELRLPTDTELGDLADLVVAGLHRPGTTPFLVSWPYLPPAERARAFLQGQWRDRGSWSPGAWSLGLAVFCDGRPVGMQELSATDFGTVREVGSFSWLGLRHHGQGIGTEMRAAVLDLAFAGLGAAEATSGAFEDNGPSLRVSAKLGYEPDGIERLAADGRTTTTRRLRLSRRRWEEFRQVPVTISGLGPCLPMFGVPPISSASAGGPGLGGFAPGATARTGAPADPTGGT